MYHSQHQRSLEIMYVLMIEVMPLEQLAAQTHLQPADLCIVLQNMLEVIKFR